jgi:CCR4-NOT transcriptional complex subunit CAF120
MFRNGPNTPPASQQQFDGDTSPLAPPRPLGDRVPSRPISMVSTYQAPLMEVNQNTLPELQPIFTYLNSHANKLYQEGYFLKLDDQNSRTCMHL